MDTFRCPTCITLLPDPYARKCKTCGQALYRKPPRVLGEENRIGANLLPIDRWMLDRLQPERKRSIFSRNRHTPPVAWDGRFATAARTPELEPSMAGEMMAPAATVEPELPTYTVSTAPDYDDTPQQPATVGALALDMFVQPMHAPEPILEPAAEPVPVPVLDEPLAEEAIVDAPEKQAYVAPPAPAPTPAPTQPVVSHEELEPEVRALVDDLYQQARAELSGSDSIFGAPATSFVTDTPALGVEDVSAPVLEQTLMPEPTEGPNRSGWHPAAFYEDPSER
jgi:hypothetical protein